MDDNPRGCIRDADARAAANRRAPHRYAYDTAALVSQADAFAIAFLRRRTV